MQRQENKTRKPKALTPHQTINKTKKGILTSPNEFLKDWNKEQKNTLWKDQSAPTPQNFTILLLPNCQKQAW